jgi:hypothetical protein
MKAVTQKELVLFLGWMEENYRLKENSMWSQQKQLNKAINQAVDELKVDLKTVRAYKLSTATGKEILHWNELALLEMYRPLSPSEGDYKTIAIGMALTGCRISDLWKMLGTIKKRDGVLCSLFKCSKPPHPEVSPIIFKPLMECLEKYGMPKVRSEQKTRIGVQSVIRSAGIDKHIELHSLRRSFITNFLSLGVIPEYLLAKVFTGHSLGGEMRIFHSYDRAVFRERQESILKLLEMVDKDRTCGVVLV